jgi:hypothetical protein
LYQPHLIDAILREVVLTPKDSTRRSPSREIVMGHDLNGEDFDGRFHYRVVVGNLNFLEKGVDLRSRTLYTSALASVNRQKSLMQGP